MKGFLELLGLGYSLESAAGWILAIIIVGGFVLLIVGGDGLTRGASGLALRAKVSPVVVGLTIVSAATSMPELVTSLIAVLAGSPDLAIGNVVGSNAANIGLILGTAVILTPMMVHGRLLRREMPLLVGFTVLFFGLSALGGGIGRVDAGIFLFGIIAINVMLVQAARRGEIEIEEVPEDPGGSYWALGGWIVGGALALAVGAELLVDASTVTARRMGVSEGVIGLTVLAVGTSLPELGATIAAARKGQTGLVVGNVVGSNLFNIGLIIGVVGLVQPFAVSGTMMRFEFPGMLILTVVLAVVMRSGKRLSRGEGFLLFGLYLGYIGFAVS